MADATANAWVVCLEIKRIQTWLFAVPKLQAMVGANAILAKLLEKTLRDLAASHGAALPSGVVRVDTSPAVKPTDGDPVKDWDTPFAEDKKDDPVLVRHAGRFEVVFCDWAKARAFAEAAAQEIADACGDVRVQCHTEALERKDGTWVRTERLTTADETAVGDGKAVLESSLLQPCEVSGVGVAARRVGGRPGARKLRVSADVVRRRDAFDDHDKAEGSKRDLVKRFYQGVPGFEGMKHPKDFSDLAAGKYLAVLCADGNAIGSGLTKALGGISKEANYFEVWRRSERYFLRTRSRIRAALATALGQTSGLANTPGDEPAVRYRLLMLGGDDILLVCRADRVLELAANLAKALDDINEGVHGDGPTPAATTIGIGIAIVHPKFPFRRAHELAEALLASAKKRSRTQTCVDWEVVTAAALPDLEAQRHGQWVGGGDGDKPAIASLRPYTGEVLGQLVEKGKTLVPESVATEPDRTARIGRGQWRRLAEQTQRGMFVGELARRELRPAAQKAVDEAVKAIADGCAGGPSAATPHGNCQHWYAIGPAQEPVAWGTPLIDLIEVAHIHTLGTRSVTRDDLEDAPPADDNEGWAAGGEDDSPDQLGAA